MRLSPFQTAQYVANTNKLIKIIKNPNNTKANSVIEPTISPVTYNLIKNPMIAM